MVTENIEEKYLQIKQIIDEWTNDAIEHKTDEEYLNAINNVFHHLS